MGLASLEAGVEAGGGFVAEEVVEAGGGFVAEGVCRASEAVGLASLEAGVEVGGWWFVAEGVCRESEAVGMASELGKAGSVMSTSVEWTESAGLASLASDVEGAMLISVSISSSRQRYEVCEAVENSHAIRSRIMFTSCCRKTRNCSRKARNCSRKESSCIWLVGCVAILRRTSGLRRI